MPTTERPTMLERFNESSVIRWITGRGASANGHANSNVHAGNGHATNGKPQATSLLARSNESKEIATIVDLMRFDYQVAFCERILQANVAAVRVTIAAEGDDPVAVKCAERLQELWDSSVSKMVDDVAYGRVAHEKVWECDEVAQIHYVRKLEPLPFRESRMVLEDDGSFGGIEMKTKSNSWELIPAFEAWWQALGATAKQPHGQSRFVPAPYEVWKNKAGTVRNRASATSKFALRGPIIRGPIKDFDETTQLDYDVLSLMAPAVDIWARGGLLYLSNDVHPAIENEFKFKVEQAELQGFDPNALNITIERHDVEMCRAFGIPEQTIIEAGAVGTYGSIAQKMLILFATVEEILSQRVESFQKYIIAPTCEVNGLPESATVTATFVPLTKRPDAFVFQVITLLLANPAFIEGILSGGIDLREILTQAGLPVTDELETVLQAVAQRLASAGGMPPGQQQGGRGFGADDDIAVGGEYASTGRRQWKNNVKAIRDVLGDLIDGNTSETMAMELLQSLGLLASRAETLIADAKDNATVDDPEFSLADELWDEDESLALGFDESKVKRDSGKFSKTQGAKKKPEQKPQHAAKPVVSDRGKRAATPAPRPPERTPLSDRAARAKASHNPSTKEKQDVGERIENEIAKAMGGKKSGDNKPMDVFMRVAGQLVGLESKSINDAKDQRVNMRKDSRQRKEAMMKKEKLPAFVVAYDNRDKYQGGAHKDKFSGHNVYVRQGVGAFSLASMVKVKDFAEAKAYIRKVLSAG